VRKLWIALGAVALVGLAAAPETAARPVNRAPFPDLVLDGAAPENRFLV
jgi:hypothetical protein